MKEVFGKTKNGDTVTAYTIKNNNGMSATIIDFGATVTKLIVPDKDGVGRDVMLGYDTVAEYEEGDKFFGAIIGRNANRICKGEVTIDGTTYQMDQNDNDNNLHSGYNGVDKMLWTVIGVDENSVTFICKSNDMEQGLPGDLTMTVKYLITDENEFKIIYDADAEKKTVINLTSHMYFNLNGDSNGDILDHVVKINADHYNPVIDFKAIPTEENAPVAGTVFDFRKPKKVGEDVNKSEMQLEFVGGFDHNYVINGGTGKLRSFATVCSEESGISMELFSDLTGTQFYSGNCIGDTKGKNGAMYHNRSGLCLEPQFIPNAVNFIPEGDIDSPIFDINEHYHTESVYVFSNK